MANKPFQSRFLLKGQKNQLFTTIQDKGMSPADFAFEIEETILKDEKITITHKTTGYYFAVVINSAVNYRTTFSPGKTAVISHGKHTSWVGVVQNVELWVEYLKREIETVDLWEALVYDNQLVQEATQQPSENLPFSESELPDVWKALDEIKSYVVKTHELSEDQKKIVDARFSYIEEAAKRMGRKDWVNIVISNLLSIVITLSLSGESTRDLFQFAGQVVRQLLGTLVYLSGPH